MSYIIPLSKPFLSHEEMQEVGKCIQSSWISSKSPHISAFEKLYAQNVSKTKYAASVNSGTSALFLALKALGIGKGDEVILPTFTMIATINAIVWAGATPVLVDCASLTDWNMSVIEIEQKITHRTKAIMPVHIYGYMCDMGAINKIAKKHKIYVIEDAAEAMGSEYRSKRAGSLSIISCFSLYANKIITTGNGGMVCTNNRKLYELVKKLSFFDFNEKTHFKHLLFGYNLVLSGIQSALGVAQVKKFKILINKRRLVYDWYAKHLNFSSKVWIMPKPLNQLPNYWFPGILCKKTTLKTKIRNMLERESVETREFFIPAHRQPVYKRIFDSEKFPNADYFTAYGLLLPSFYEMNEQNVITITNIINSLS